MNKLTLGQKQRLFTKLISELILWAYDNGYEFTEGDSYRDPRLHGQLGTKKGYSAKNSLHKLRLARDLNLFIDEEWQPATKSHTPIGEKWESMHELCRWGGRFGDGNHYSFTHQGLK